MMLVSSSDARISHGVPFPEETMAYPSWCYLYDTSHDQWMFIGVPHSPTGVIEVRW